MNFESFDFEKIKEGLKKKEFSCQEIVDFFLEKIKKEDKKISSFLTITERLARESAQEIDDLISQKKELPFLAGFPLAIKDNILIKDVKCTAASRILKDFLSPYDATVIKKLKENGAIILGKTNLDEFAMGSSTENSAFFPTKNPLDLERVPGGSSGGSAAAVSAGFILGALGSDTGGSIRQPASFCGIFGLKPTYGSVSRFGLIAFASSFDQIGPMTRNLKDCEALFEIIKGKDDFDQTSVDLEKIKKKKIDFKKIKIGLPRECFLGEIDFGIKRLIEKKIEAWKKIFQFEEISLPHTEFALPCYYIISSCEAAANLARYDGIRYNVFEQIYHSAKDLLEYYFQTRTFGFGPEVKRRILIGNFSLSRGFYDAYYLRAQQIRNLIKEDFLSAFEKVDFIFIPTSPTPPFKLGEKIKDPVKMYLSDIFTVSVSLAGLPGLSFPIGNVGHLPVGLQVIAPSFCEKEIFRLMKMIDFF